MATLNARINWDTGVVTFWGPGTFHAKEDIKLLGTAKWNNSTREWELVPTKLSKELLENRFPGLEIEEIGSKAQPTEGSNAGQILVATVPQGLPDSSSVSELLANVRRQLSAAFPAPVMIRGVLSSVKSYQQRIYMELADQDTAQERVSCVIWREADVLCKGLSDAGFTLEENLPVMFEARVDLSPRDGRISLSVVRIIAEYTAARLAAARELTNAKLLQEGLFEKNQQLQLSFLPLRLGVLTSAGGTVINDFRAALDSSKFGFELFWLSVSVQGASAVYEVVNGLKQLGQRGDLDAILLFRGGGSPAELAVFNDYEIAKAICLSPIPVVSAVGHEKDQSSAQDVSWRHFGVPKDIGRFFAELVISYRREYRDYSSRIYRSAQQLSEARQQGLAALAHAIVQSMRFCLGAQENTYYRLRNSVPTLTRSLLQHRALQLRDISKPAAALGRRLFEAQSESLKFANRRLEQQAHRVFRLTRDNLRYLGAGISAKLEKRLEQSVSELAAFRNARSQAGFAVEIAQSRLAGLESLVEGARPEVQLKRGFVMVRKTNSESYVTQASALAKDDQITLTFSDAKRRAKVSD